MLRKRLRRCPHILKTSKPCNIRRRLSLVKGFSPSGNLTSAILVSYFTLRIIWYNNITCIRRLPSTVADFNYYIIISALVRGYLSIYGNIYGIHVKKKKCVRIRVTSHEDFNTLDITLILYCAPYNIMRMSVMTLLRSFAWVLL